MGVAELELDAQVARQRTQVTILTRTRGEWSQEETEKLRGTLFPPPAIHQQGSHPEILMLSNDRSRVCCCHALGHDDFDHQIIRGLDNPDLPFPAPTTF